MNEFESLHKITALDYFNVGHKMEIVLGLNYIFDAFFPANGAQREAGDV